MTARDDSAFRLHMAATLTRKAREALDRGDWREAAMFARGAVEAAAKSVLACLVNVPRSHEPADLLDGALQQPGFPEALAEEARQLVDLWRGYGMEQHILLSYGDERNRIDPWSLVTEKHARMAVSDAEAAAGFADRFRGAAFADRET